MLLQIRINADDRQLRKLINASNNLKYFVITSARCKCIQTNRLKQPHTHTYTHTHTHTQNRSLESSQRSTNQWKVVLRGMNLLSLFIFLLQRLMYFCFLSYGSFWRGCSVRKDKHMGWLIIGTGTSSANNAGFIHRRPCLRLCFSLPPCSPSLV